MIVKIKMNNPMAIIPQYQTVGSAGFDLASCEYAVVMPGETKLIDTGLSFKIPEGYEMQIRPRSGMSLKTKIRIGNSPGTIDSDFVGVVKIIVDNIGTQPYVINVYDRIAQGVIAPVKQVDFEVTDELTQTERGTGGFGHTGT